MEHSSNIELDFSKMQLFGFDESGKQNPLLAEEFRSIKREILKESFPSISSSDPVKNRILVTSLYEGEGKTFTSLNLARSLSFEINKNVLLVDTNVMSPMLGSFIANDGKEKKGLIDYLREELLATPDVIYKTNINRLKLLPMGSCDSMSNEYLNSDAMNDLMSEFKKRYRDRVVIFDGPPLIGINEGYTLCENIDQVIIVIEDEKIKKSELLQAVKGLPKGVKIHYLLNKTISGLQWKKTK